MGQRPEPPPEGALIKTALKRSGMSARKAAQEAGLSEGRWRQIVDGYQVVSAGNYQPLRGPAETVARMAAIAGVTAEALETAGRDDAARELRILHDVSAKAIPTSLPAGLADIEDASPAEAAMLAYLAAMRQEIRSLRDEVHELKAVREQDDRHRKGA